MIVGVPGAGISAFFYLLCVLLMPFLSLWRMARTGDAKAPRWRLVGRQLFIGAGIAGGLLAGGWLVTFLAGAPIEVHNISNAAVEATVRLATILGRIGIFLGLGTLVLVLGSVQLFALLTSRPDAVPITIGADEG